MSDDEYGDDFDADLSALEEPVTTAPAPVQNSTIQKSTSQGSRGSLRSSSQQNLQQASSGSLQRLDEDRDTGTSPMIKKSTSKGSRRSLQSGSQQNLPNAADSAMGDSRGSQDGVRRERTLEKLGSHGDSLNPDALTPAQRKPRGSVFADYAPDMDDIGQDSPMEDSTTHVDASQLLVDAAEEQGHPLASQPESTTAVEQADGASRGRKKSPGKSRRGGANARGSQRSGIPTRTDLLKAGAGKARLDPPSPSRPGQDLSSSGLVALDLFESINMQELSASHQRAVTEMNNRNKILADRNDKLRLKLKEFSRALDAAINRQASSTTNQTAKGVRMHQANHITPETSTVTDEELRIALKRVAQYKSENKKLRKQLDDYTNATHVAELENSMHAVESREKDFKKEISTLKSEIRRMAKELQQQSEINSALPEQVKSLTAELSGYKQKVRQMQQEFHSKDKANRNDERVIKLESRLRKMRNQSRQNLSQTGGTDDAAKVAQLEQKVQDMAQSATQDRNRHQAMKNKYQKQIGDLKDQMSRLERQLKQSHRSATAAEKELVRQKSHKLRSSRSRTDTPSRSNLSSARRERDRGSNRGSSGGLLPAVKDARPESPQPDASPQRKRSAPAVERKEAVLAKRGSRSSKKGSRRNLARAISEDNAAAPDSTAPVGEQALLEPSANTAAAAADPSPTAAETSTPAPAVIENSAETAATGTPVAGTDALAAPATETVKEESDYEDDFEDTGADI